MQMDRDVQAYDSGKHLFADALKGAAAGAAAVWVLDRVDWSMFNQEDPETRQRTREVRPDGLDMRHLRRCVELATEALEVGDAPLGSVLVAADGAVLAEDCERISKHSARPESS